MVQFYGETHCVECESVEVPAKLFHFIKNWVHLVSAEVALNVGSVDISRSGRTAQ